MPRLTRICGDCEPQGGSPGTLSTIVRRALSILQTTSTALAAVTLLLIVVSLSRSVWLPNVAMFQGRLLVHWPPTEVVANGQPLVETVGMMGVYYQHVRLPASGQASDPPVSNVVLVYLYSPLVLFSILPVARLSGWYLRRLRGPQPGYCRKCSYDLRATPDRCPECGEVPCQESTSSLKERRRQAHSASGRLSQRR